MCEDHFPCWSRRMHALGRGSSILGGGTPRALGHRMSTKIDQTVRRLEGSILITKVLKPLVGAGAVFLWLITLVEVVRAQNYNGNLTFDLYLARVGGPTASHATTYLIFLSIFPIAYAMLRSIIPAFLIEVLAFEIHEGLWQLPYYVRVAFGGGLARPGPSGHARCRDHGRRRRGPNPGISPSGKVLRARHSAVGRLPPGVARSRVPRLGPLKVAREPGRSIRLQYDPVGEPGRVPGLGLLCVRSPRRSVVFHETPGPSDTVTDCDTAL